MSDDKESAVTPTPCKFGDLTCPCQDGDECHYEGENPMTTMTDTPTQRERPADFAKRHGQGGDAGRITQELGHGATMSDLHAIPDPNTYWPPIQELMDGGVLVRVEPDDLVILAWRVTDPNGQPVNAEWTTSRSRSPAMLQPGRYALVRIGEVADDE